MGKPLQQTDNVFRGAHHPVVFRKNLFQPGPFLRLWNDDNPRTIEASFIWQRYAPALSHVHSFGCRTSKQRNHTRRPDKKDVYCGAYNLKVSDIRGLASIEGLSEVATADITHEVENNEIAHASLKIELDAGVHEDAIEGVKTAIVACLWRRSCGPLLHRCNVDCNLAPHPSAQLPLGPSGPYVEDRSIGMRIFYLIRFWFVYTAWKVGFFQFA